MNNLLDKTIELAEKSCEKGMDFACKINDGLGNAKKDFLNKNDSESEAVDEANIIGTWRLDAVALKGLGLRKDKELEKKNYYIFLPDGQVICNVYGKEFKTLYSVDKGCISFNSMELTALKLVIKEDTLYMKNHLGVTLIFKKV